jgi:coproporphyrinogen III oxidase
VAFNYHKIICYVSNIATGASMAFRKSICNEILPFPIMKDFHHDEWIAILSSKRDAFVMLHEKYFYYRIHENQQVGGVFFDKNNENKSYLTQFFNIQNENIPLYMFKKRLSKIVSLNRLSKKLLETHPKYHLIFEELIINTNLSYYTTKRKMQIKYPLKSFFINISDKFFSKRRF